MCFIRISSLWCFYCFILVILSLFCVYIDLLRCLMYMILICVYFTMCWVRDDLINEFNHNHMFWWWRTQFKLWNCESIQIWLKLVNCGFDPFCTTLRKNELSKYQPVTTQKLLGVRCVLEQTCINDMCFLFQNLDEQLSLDARAHGAQMLFIAHSFHVVYPYGKISTIRGRLTHTCVS